MCKYLAFVPYAVITSDVGVGAVSLTIHSHILHYGSHENPWQRIQYSKALDGDQARPSTHHFICARRNTLSLHVCVSTSSRGVGCLFDSRVFDFSKHDDELARAIHNIFCMYYTTASFIEQVANCHILRNLTSAAPKMILQRTQYDTSQYRASRPHVLT